MPYLIATTTHVHNWCIKLLATLLLLQSFSPLQATTIGNYAEMSLALATIPLDIAANKHDLAKNTRKAAIYHLAADSLSVLNKLFFIYNNLSNQYQLFERFAPINRDLLVNYSFALLDLKRIHKNMNILSPARKKPVVNQDTTDDLLNFDFDEDDADMAINQIGFDDLLDFDFDEEELPQEEPPNNEELIEEEEKKLSQLIQKWRTVILPTLKGLTAFALACAQNNATPYENISRRNARYLAASAYALTRLLAEYSTLTAKSRYKKTIIIMLMLNTAWLAYEVKNYIATIPEAEIPDDLGPRTEQPLVRMHRENGHCDTCWEDNMELAELGCGHRACLDCLGGHINAHPLNRIPCIAGCGRNITREEFRDISDDDRVRLAAFDAACRPVRPMTREQAAALGAKPCPGCGVPIYRNSGCQHMTCNRCRHEFCWICLGNYRFGPCQPYQCYRPFDLDI